MIFQFEVDGLSQLTEKRTWFRRSDSPCVQPMSLHQIIFQTPHFCVMFDVALIASPKNGHGFVTANPTRTTDVIASTTFSNLWCFSLRSMGSHNLTEKRTWFRHCDLPCVPPMSLHQDVFPTSHLCVMVDVTLIASMPEQGMVSSPRNPPAQMMSLHQPLPQTCYFSA